ncbi:MAG: hypothetical protein DRN27_08980 [Thermoplasmata archaeon]|nr:MAG: hypothetical protein DRN27_08980 [Thermoplasmata archaeon]
MEWTVKIENEEKQRIRMIFHPLLEKIELFGEARVKNNKWFIFSRDEHDMEITLEQLQEKFETVIILMKKRLAEYENLNKGFSVLKWVAFEDED